MSLTQSWYDQSSPVAGLSVHARALGDLCVKEYPGDPGPGPLLLVGQCEGPGGGVQQVGGGRPGVVYLGPHLQEQASRDAIIRARHNMWGGRLTHSTLLGDLSIYT